MCASVAAPKYGWPTNLTDFAHENDSMSIIAAKISVIGVVSNRQKGKCAFAAEIFQLTIVLKQTDNASPPRKQTSTGTAAVRADKKHHRRTICTTQIPALRAQCMRSAR